jgi:hypothetical protein
VVIIHPLQRECDSQNPKEFAAWCWAAGIPDPSPARPIPIPLIGPMLVEGVSQMLWDFGFRHHPELQQRWINGTAGLATIAEITDTEPEADRFDEKAAEFLSANNPKMLELIRKASPAEREELLTKLESSFTELSSVIQTLKEQI